jgi:amidase
VAGGTDFPGTIGGLLVRPALELSELLRSGQIHARELVDAALSRLEEREPRINAFLFVDGERALAEAEKISPNDPRPFAGVPIAIKDGTPQEGLPIRNGSALFEGHIADHDAATIRRLREAGFVSIGRTTMPEFGILPTTEPRLTGPTRNPWDLFRTPGGSSGGSTAAVAAGVVPLAHGSDGGGSLRIPAACCGLVGLKASRGRISFAPDRGDDPLVTEGVLTRTVADTAALLDVLAGYEPGDTTWAPPPARSFGETAGMPPSGLRVGLMLEPPVSADLDPICARAAEDAADLLEELGHHVEAFELGPLAEDEWEAFDDVWAVLAAEGVAAGEGLLGRPPMPEDVEPLTWALYEKGRALDALSYRRSLAALQRVAREVVRAALAYDALLTPALAQRPVPIGTITGMEWTDPLNALSRSDRFTPYTALWNMTGQPAISLPLVHGDDGLPLGVQLVGRPAGEAPLLTLAAQLEEARPWRHRLSPLARADDPGG